MTKILPWQYPPAGLDRYKMAPAISSGVPTRSKGTRSLGNLPLGPMAADANSDWNTVLPVSHVL